MRSPTIWTASVAKTAWGGHVTCEVEGAICRRLVRNCGAGASHASLWGDRGESRVWQQNTWKSAWPSENVPMCAAGWAVRSRRHPA